MVAARHRAALHFQILFWLSKICMRLKCLPAHIVYLCDKDAINDTPFMSLSAHPAQSCSQKTLHHGISNASRKLKTSQLCAVIQNWHFLPEHLFGIAHTGWWKPGNLRRQTTNLFKAMRNLQTCCDQQNKDNVIYDIHPPTESRNTRSFWKTHQLSILFYANKCHFIAIIIVRCEVMMSGQLQLILLWSNLMLHPSPSLAYCWAFNVSCLQHRANK